MRACGAPPRFVLKKLIWLSSGFDSCSVNATRRPSTGETIGLLVSPTLAWKPVVRETARHGEPGQLGAGGLSVLPMSVWVAEAGAAAANAATIVAMATSFLCITRLNTPAVDPIRRRRAVPSNAKRRRSGAAFASEKWSDLQKGDVDGLGALVALLFLVGHPGALGERAVPVAVDPREVDEQVTAALGGRYEAVALVVAEPLDGASRHMARTSTELRCCVCGGCLCNDPNATRSRRCKAGSLRQQTLPR